MYSEEEELERKYHRLQILEEYSTLVNANRLEWSKLSKSLNKVTALVS